MESMPKLETASFSNHCLNCKDWEVPDDLNCCRGANCRVNRLITSFHTMKLRSWEHKVIHAWRDQYEIYSKNSTEEMAQDPKNTNRLLFQIKVGLERRAKNCEKFGMDQRHLKAAMRSLRSVYRISVRHPDRWLKECLAGVVLYYQKEFHYCIDKKKALNE